MSLEQLLSEVAFKLGSEIADPTIKCRIEDYQIKRDRHGRRMLVLYLRCVGHGRVVVALSPMYAREFAARLKKLGVEKISDMLSLCFEFEKVKLDKVREDYNDPHPRYLPKDVVPCPDQLLES